VSLAPDYVEPIVAWRVWRVADDGGEVFLRSLFHTSNWPRYEPLEAHCEASRLLPWRWWGGRHDAPSEGCECGIYGAPWSLIASELKRGILVRRRGLVIGQVSLWGRVVEAAHGWRAGFAYPKRLFLSVAADSDPVEQYRMLNGLESYGVGAELVRFDNLIPVLELIDAEGTARAATR
jgi:hypothetical protein